MNVIMILIALMLFAFWCTGIGSTHCKRACVKNACKTKLDPPSAAKFKQADIDRLRKRIIKLSEGDRMADSWGCLGKSIDEWEKIHSDKFIILGLEVKDKFAGGVLGVGK